MLVLQFPEKAKSNLGGLPGSDLRAQSFRGKITISQNMQQRSNPVLLFTHTCLCFCCSVLLSAKGRLVQMARENRIHREQTSTTYLQSVNKPGEKQSMRLMWKKQQEKDMERGVGR